MTSIRLLAATCCLAVFLPTGSAVGSPVSVLIREAVEQACKVSGREGLERTARESAEQAVAVAVRRHGPAAAEAVSRGGLELLEVGARHGDDVLRLAKSASPAGQRALALQADRLVPLARRYGPVVLDLEARAPGLGGRVFSTFGDDLGSAVARKAATEDLPRLVLAAERADSPATRALLWSRYQQGGGAFLKAIDWKVVLAAGTSVAIINAAHRATTPYVAMGDSIRENPEIAGKAVDGMFHGWSAFSWAMLPPAVVFCLLWRFGLMPWHRPVTDRRPTAEGPYAGGGVRNDLTNIKPVPTSGTAA
jgi:hypothetical protein